MTELVRKIRKLTDDDIADIRGLAALGFTQREIARSYGVSTKTVRYWTNEAFRERENRRIAVQYANDPERFSSRSRDYYSKNREQIRERQREYQRQISGEKS